MKGRRLTSPQLEILIRAGLLYTTRTVYIKNTPPDINIAVAVPKRIFREYIVGGISRMEMLDSSECVRYWKE